MKYMLKKKNIKASVDDDGNLHFWEDGVNERDWLILLTSIVFFGGIFIGLILTIVGMFMGFELPDKYLQLIEAMDVVIVTIVGGLFTVKATQTIANRKTNKDDSSDVNNHNEGDDI